MKPIWSKGKCVSCARPGFQPLMGQSQLSNKTSLKGRSKLKVRRKGKSKEVVEFFKELTEDYSHGGARSIESGKGIANVSAVNMAHILPKGDFPELATNKNNIVILTWEEHTRFDELLNRHEFIKLEKEFPNSWPLIVSRLKTLLKLVETSKPLSKELQKYIDGN